MSDYDIALKKWAALRLNCDWRDIEKVGVKTNAGWGGTDVTGGAPATAELIAVMREPNEYGLDEREILNLIDDGKMYAKNWFDFGDLLRELVAIDVTDADRRVASRQGSSPAPLQPPV